MYFGKRYYSPYLQRWTQPDPLEIHAPFESGEPNLYSYVSGRALKNIDPLGLCGQDGTGGACNEGGTQGANSETAHDAGKSTANDTKSPGAETAFAAGAALAVIDVNNELAKQESPGNAEGYDNAAEEQRAKVLEWCGDACALNPNAVVAGRLSTGAVVVGGLLWASGKDGQKTRHGAFPKVKVPRTSKPKPAPAAPPPTESYHRESHYGKTPKTSDRKHFGAGPGEVVDHDPPLGKRFFDGDPNVREKPGYQMTPEERKASANDRSRMRLQPVEESKTQSAEVRKFTMDQRKKHGLGPHPNARKRSKKK